MRIARILAWIPATAVLGGCWGTVTENPAAEYVRRTDTITMSAGEAKNVNAATHIIDPWPRYVGNRRIPGDGERMATAAQRYHRPPQRGAGGGGAGLTPVGGITEGGAGTGAGGGAGTGTGTGATGAAPAQ
jgi:hypothetical protein